MAYDDVIRVADLKTRSAASSARAQGSRRQGDQLLYTTEYMHPRMEEVWRHASTQARQWIENSPKLFAFLNRRIDKGRRVKTGTLFSGFSGFTSRPLCDASAGAACATISKLLTAMPGFKKRKRSWPPITISLWSPL